MCSILGNSYSFAENSYLTVCIQSKLFSVKLIISLDNKEILRENFAVKNSMNKVQINNKDNVKYILK